MRRLLIAQAVLTTLTSLLFLSGCSEEFEPFNEVRKLRILAIQAEPPTLMPGETSDIRALVFEPEGELVEYQWDWCPLRTGSEAGFECAITEQELIEAASELDPIAAALIPSYDLGTDQEVSLEHFLSEEVLDAFCGEGQTSELPFPGVGELPECGDFLTISLRLTVYDGVDTAQAIKNVRFALNTSLVPNTNPVFSGVFARLEGESASQFEVLDEDSIFNMAVNSKYELESDINEASAEIFTPSPTNDEPNPEPQSERLFLTWFVTDGETEFGRTGFIDGVLSFEDLTKNNYFTPSDSGTAQFFLVIQDERGGVDWITRTIQITEF